MMFSFSLSQGFHEYFYEVILIEFLSANFVDLHLKQCEMA